jgi:hypothetical protein
LIVSLTYTVPNKFKRRLTMRRRKFLLGSTFTKKAGRSQFGWRGRKFFMGGFPVSILSSERSWIGLERVG